MSSALLDGMGAFLRSGYPAIRRAGRSSTGLLLR